MCSMQMQSVTLQLAVHVHWEVSIHDVSGQPRMQEMLSSLYVSRLHLTTLCLVSVSGMVVHVKL